MGTDAGGPSAIQPLPLGSSIDQPPVGGTGSGQAPTAQVPAVLQPSDHGLADMSFMVHLQSLKDLAQELETQFDAVNTPAEGLFNLATRPVSLGDFGEAAALRDRHQTAVEQMADLMETVQRVIGFAADVTNTVQVSYERYDNHIGSGFGGHPQVPTTIPTPAAIIPVTDGSTNVQAPSPYGSADAIYPRAGIPPVASASPGVV